MRRRLTLGAILLALVGYLSFATQIFDWLTRIDFIVVHQNDPGWLGDAVRFLFDLPPLPAWAPWGVAIAGLVLIFWDSRRVANRVVQRQTIIAQEGEGERDKHTRIAKWLETVFSDKGLRVNTVTLFGSIVHDHYPTSDVDIIIMFDTIPDTRIGQLVRKIKETVASDFHATFGHPLHATFFCAHEQAAMNDFVATAGKHEILRPKK